MDTDKGENPREWQPSKERENDGPSEMLIEEVRCRLQIDLDRAMWK